MFIFGGSGSLGIALISKYLDSEKIYIYSRDENKHWQIKLKFNNHPNLNFIIGNIRDRKKIQQSLLRVNPKTIIIAAALKHVDKCEYETHECIQTNIFGVQNVLDCIETNKYFLGNLKSVCFISTDKACSPVNVYGMCKSISEQLVIEKAKSIKEIKWCIVRYGNVLNSRGSIIPILHKIGKNPKILNYSLTHPKMSRFVMPLEESVALINHAIEKSESGDITIPLLKSMKIEDLISIFSEKYEKNVVITGIRPGEKIAEQLINTTQSKRLKYSVCGKYIYIKPSFNCEECKKQEAFEYNSGSDIMSKTNLKKYLSDLQLLT